VTARQDARQAAALTRVAERAAERAVLEAAPLPATIDSLLTAAVARHGDAPFMTEIASGRALTYAELGAGVARAAGVLRAAGVAHGTRVAALLPNILEFPVLWLALARLGAVMVSVNSRSTATELGFVLRDSVATHLVTDDHGLAVLTGVDCAADGAPEPRVLRVESLANTDAHAAADPDADAVPEAGPDVTADTIVGFQYTSGTTGMPKACVLTNRYWLTVAAVVTRTWPVRPTRILIDGPFFYMDPQYQTLMTLMTGARAFLAPRPSLTRFLGWLRDFDIDCGELPDGIATAPPSPADREHRLRNAWIFGVDPAKHASLEQRYGIRLREFYGMTEVGMPLYTPFEETGMVGSGSCGVTAPWAETRVVDPETLTLVAPGVVGELQVRGPGIFAGYHARPEANAASFAEGGWFRTGDLFTVHADGFHRIVGRIKDMVRRNGENIAAREVEAVIERMPEVAECAVLAVPDEQRDEEVKAYLVLVDPADPAAAPDVLLPRLFEHCARHLASFKIPRYVAFRAEFPLTPSMKIAKAVLRAEAADLRAGSYDRVTGTWIGVEPP
jgi:crotonobetaine/carnitine-CoA ligase